MSAAQPPVRPTLNLPICQSANLPIGIAPPIALVIDDESAVRGVIRRWLQRGGWAVDEASTGIEALDLLEARTAYDVVICDLRMPAADGPELYRWIRTHRPDVLQHLVFSSGDIEDENAHTFLLSTGRPILGKPFELSSLADVVSRARTPGMTE
jgi:two-component system cell cycle sensor histidine kinase/response regulator CckA